MGFSCLTLFGLLLAYEDGLRRRIHCPDPRFISEGMTKIDHILLTHAHLDHTCGILFLTDNVLSQRQTPITIYSIPFVINSLKEHMFNNVIWPDFTQIPNADSPVGLVKGRSGAILYTGDTGPTKKIWKVVASVKELRAIISV